MRYSPIDVRNLATIQTRILECFPDSKRQISSLFYIDDNYSKFMAIDELRQELIRLDLFDYVHSFGFYHVLPTGPGGTDTHIDSSTGDYSFNLPIENCDNTFVNFYTSYREPELRFTKEGVPYYFIDKDACELVDRIEMTQPYIINVKEIHNVSNDNPTTRITVLIRLTAQWNYLEWDKKRQLNSQSGSSRS